MSSAMDRVTDRVVRRNARVADVQIRTESKSPETSKSVLNISASEEMLEAKERHAGATDFFVYAPGRRATDSSV